MDRALLKQPVFPVETYKEDLRQIDERLETFDLWDGAPRKSATWTLILVVLISTVGAVGAGWAIAEFWTVYNAARLAQ